MMAKFFVSVGGLVFLLFLGSGAAFTDFTDFTVVCFNAHVQDVPLILLYGSSLVTSLEIKTFNDTTATKKRFHVDYMHPKNPKWMSYQEDRLTKIYFLPSEHKRRVTKFVFSDPFVAEFLRVSLFEVDSMGWLGEICVSIQFIINKKVKHPMGEGSCAKGFYGDGKYCVDINECADVTGNFCLRKQHCKDVPGSYSCLGTCVGDLLPHKKTKECQDPCFRDGLVCHKKARCWKGECVCNTGFEGDGLYCLDTCTADSLTCDRNAYCEKGNCVCRSGYEGNGAVCQAACGFRRHLCHPNAECRRNNCKCKPGFVGNGISKCVFSRALYEKAKKEETTVPRMDIVETDIFEQKKLFSERFTSSSSACQTQPHSPDLIQLDEEPKESNKENQQESPDAPDIPEEQFVEEEPLVLHTFQRVHLIFNDED